MASITPTTAGKSTPYTITASKGVIADFSLDLTSGSLSSAFTVTHPAGAAIDVIGPSTTVHPVGAVADGTVITDGNRQILVSKSGSTLTCTITATSGAAVDKWTVRMTSAPAESSWTVQQTEGGVARVMCDPVTGITLSSIEAPAPSPPIEGGWVVREKQHITVTGAAPVTAATVVGAPPTVYWRWRVENGPPMPDFPKCSNAPGAPSLTTQMPGVYGGRTFTLVEEVWFDAACPAAAEPPPGFLWSSESTSVEIASTPQRILLVLDRSGSMFLENRWTNAELGARLMIDLVAAVRGHTNKDDKVGVRVFEDGACGWGSPAVLPANGNIPLSSPTTAQSLAVGPPPFNFGAPGACTPIGDALIAAMNDFTAGGVEDEPHFTIILLTDGIENSGRVRVDPSIVAPGTQVFADVRPQGGRAEVSTRLTIFAIGLGTFVQDQTLNQLPWPAYPFTGMPPGWTPKYRNVLNVNELADAIGQMVSYSMETRPFAPSAPKQPDPSPPATARYFSTEPGVRIVAAAVQWDVDDPSNTLKLTSRPADTAGPYTDSGASFKRSPKHGFVSADLGNGAAAKEWRIVYEKGGAGQDIPANRLLLYKDLDTLADARFDKLAYRTGEKMQLEVRARTGSEPVSGLEVIVELARPGDSLGTYLVTHGKGWQPGQQAGGDPVTPKGSMLQYALNTQDRGSLEIVEPPGFFVDGSNQLWEDKRPQAAGNYVNTFDGVGVEGTYTFRFYVHGTLADGSEFSQVMTHSVWVGVLPDPSASQVAVSTLSRDQLQVTITPRDAGGQYLGPFWPAVIDFQTTSGTWVGDVVDNYDGSYTRILQIEPGTAPTVTPVVDGVPLPPVIVTTGIIGSFVGWLQRLCKKIVRFVLRLFHRKLKP